MVKRKRQDDVEDNGNEGPSKRREQSSQDEAADFLEEEEAEVEEDYYDGWTWDSGIIEKVWMKNFMCHAFFEYKVKTIDWVFLKVNLIF